MYPRLIDQKASKEEKVHSKCEEVIFKHKLNLTYCLFILFTNKEVSLQGCYLACRSIAGR